MQIQIISIRRLHYLIVPMLFFPALLHSQLPHVDSLRAIWMDTTIRDSSRLNALGELTWNGYIFTNPDSAIILAQIEYAIAKEKGYVIYQYQSLNNLGVAYSVQGDFEKAETAHLKALNMAQENGDSFEIGNRFSNLAIVRAQKGDYPGAIEYYNQALEMFTLVGKRSGIANVLANLGLTYRNMGNFRMAVESITKSMRLKLEWGDTTGSPHSLNTLGNIYVDQEEYEQAREYFQQSYDIHARFGRIVYSSICLLNIGTTYLEEQQYQLAKQYILRAYIIQDSINANHALAATLVNVCRLYTETQEYDSAEYYCQRSLQFSREMGAKFEEAKSLLMLGKNRIATRRYDQALALSNAGLKISEDIGEKTTIKEGYENLYAIHKAKGNFRDALRSYERFIQNRDSLQSKENRIKIDAERYRFEFDKKQAIQKVRHEAEQEAKDQVIIAQQEKIEKERSIRIALVAILILFALLIWGIGDRFRVTRKKNRIIEKERDRSETLLLNILPEETARELKEKGKADAKLYDEVTVIFTDFVGFTALSEAMEPSDVVAGLDLCFSEFDKIIEKYGIEKIKTIGDAYMAAGGLPAVTPTHASDIARAALEIMDFMDEWIASQQAMGKAFFEIRMGIHTGPVVAGIVGLKKFQYDIWGDTVNTASRMESASEKGRINISIETYQQIRHMDEFYFESRGKKPVKGKGELEMFYLSKAKL